MVSTCVYLQSGNMWAFLSPRRYSGFLTCTLTAQQNLGVHKKDLRWDVEKQGPLLVCPPGSDLHSSPNLPLQSQEKTSENICSNSTKAQTGQQECAGHWEMWSRSSHSPYRLPTNYRNAKVRMWNVSEETQMIASGIQRRSLVVQRDVAGRGVGLRKTPQGQLVKHRDELIHLRSAEEPFWDVSPHLRGSWRGQGLADWG
ncbi:PREDICTED: putative uncharacterized protein C1orf126 [Cercocebus atys]|uniref:putative uncharacterized protein C1orf126 n=1 Tax=Cercocebus atys TaxID=9531 RepID=UPI0005F4767F|nr:PREDICTED: putative uncharacterized protein C1orf126 [Cercocebus atys]